MNAELFLRNMRKKDVLSNNRIAVVLNSSAEVRDEVYSVTRSCHYKWNSGEELMRLKMECLESDDDYPFDYNCIDWAFDKVGLPKYNRDNGPYLPSKLRFNDFSDVCWIPSPRGGSLVMYLDKEKVNHWGVIEKITDDIYVNSKFGLGHVYRHPLGHVPIEYGDYAMFLERRR
jgi:hypothetical protein